MTHAIPIDLNNMPDLAKIAEEVEATKIPRELKRDEKTVAVIIPAEKTAHDKKHTSWEQIESAFGSWSDIDADAVIADIYRNRNAGSRPADRP